MPVCPSSHIVDRRRANAAVGRVDTASTKQADSDKAILSIPKGNVGSPNVPPSSTCNIVYIDSANAALSAVVAVSANLADSDEPICTIHPLKAMLAAPVVQ